jgi:hypothetical protein
MKKYLLALTLTVGALASTSATALAQAPAQCTTSFHVLHDDRIGSMQLPAGTYQVTSEHLTCAQAPALFAEFLNDYNGVLPKPWRSTTPGRGQGVFLRGNSGQRFVVLRTGEVPATAANGGSHGDLLCPGAFDVLHNDRIGRLAVPKGDYRVTLLGGNLSCDAADRLFARFLRDVDGRLGGGWVLLPSTGELVNGSSHYGFRIKSVNAVGG